MPDLNRGLFCSEVVAYAYQQLGIPFNNKPEQTSPADIADRDISGMERVDVFCDSDPGALVQEAGIINLIAEQASRHSFVGQLTALKTLTSATADFAQQVKQDAVANGVPPERLTPEGFPLMFPEILDSLLKLSQETVRLMLAVGTSMNSVPHNLSPLQEGTKGLEALLESIKAGEGTLLDVAKTFSAFVEPLATVYESYRTDLKDLFRGHINAGEQIIAIAHPLYDQFQAALREHLAADVHRELEMFVEKMSELFTGFADLNHARVLCWQTMYADSPIAEARHHSVRPAH